MLKGSIDTLSTRPHRLTNVDGADIVTDGSGTMERDEHTFMLEASIAKLSTHR